MAETQSRHSIELNHPKWLHKRQQILARDMFECQSCHTKHSLEVHHLYYISGSSLWQYPKNSLVTLCRSCHQTWHDTHEIEYRDKAWGNNRYYKAPTKTKKKSNKHFVPKVKKRLVNHPAVVSEKQKEVLKRRNAAKRVTLRKAGYNGKELTTLYKETRSLTLDELKRFLLDKI